VKTLALVLGVVAEGGLAIGGNIGGANVFVYGIRVLKRDETPARQALDPRGVKAEKPEDESKVVVHLGALAVALLTRILP
jgi:hypothetical protein